MKSTWQKHPSVTRAGKFFYTATTPQGSVITVSQSWLSGRWGVREGSRELPAWWTTASEAKRYAETALSFGRFA